MREEDSSTREIIKDIRHENQTIVLVLAGEIDMKCSPKLRNKFMELLRNEPPLFVINMQQVEFMDSSGLGVLVEVLKCSRRYGGQLKLVGLGRSVRNIFEISRLDSVFQIYDTEEEALS
jgi:anti-sigma B factor antagonist